MIGCLPTLGPICQHTAKGTLCTSPISNDLWSPAKKHNVLADTSLPLCCYPLCLNCPSFYLLIRFWESFLNPQSKHRPLLPIQAQRGPWHPLLHPRVTMLSFVKTQSTLTPPCIPQGLSMCLGLHLLKNVDICVCVVKILKFYSHSKFQLYNAVLSRMCLFNKPAQMTLMGIL